MQFSSWKKERGREVGDEKKTESVEKVVVVLDRHYRKRQTIERAA